MSTSRGRNPRSAFRTSARSGPAPSAVRRDTETLRRDTDRDRVLRAEELVAYVRADQVIDTRIPAKP